MQLEPDEIHCWSVRLDITPGACAALSAILSPEEQIRCARMRPTGFQRRFIAAHGGLRRLLARYVAAPPSEIDFVHNEFGKPALSARFGGRLEFSLSHSGELALIAVAADAEIGVDVEQIRHEPDFGEVARWFFDADEVEALNRLPSEDRAPEFLRCWTRKEAYAKALGQGLGAKYQIAQPSGWSVYSLQPAPGYVASVAVEGSGWRVSQRFGRFIDR